MKKNPVILPKEIYTEEIQVRCETCLHFKYLANPKFKTADGKNEVCSKLYRQPSDYACPEYNVSPFSILKGQNLEDFFELVKKLPTQTLSNLAVLLNHEKRTRSLKYRMGEIVYFKFFTGSGDYLSNYARGRVMSVSSGSIFITGKLLGGNKVNTAILSIKSAIRSEDWPNVRSRLLSAKRLVDPKWKEFTTNPQPMVTEDYRPELTIDDFNSVKKPKKKVQK